MMTLAGQVAVVTGASRGIGKAIALALANRGAKLCLVGRRAEMLELAAADARVWAQQVNVYPTDLTLDPHIERLGTNLRRDFGQVDILIHSAGVYFQGKVQDAPIQQFDEQFRTNVRGPYLLTQTLLPLLKICPGQIVFVNSTVGLNARATVGQYAATQHAVKAIADCLREEVNADGIRVISVFPGRTATPRQELIFRSEDRDYRPELLLQPEDVASVVLHALSLPRTAEVTNIHLRPLIKSY